MAARAAAQRIEQEELEKPKKKGPALELDKQFDRFMRLTVFAAPKVDEKILREYEFLAGKKTEAAREGWRTVLRKIVESPKPGKSTIDEYFMAAISSQRPVPVMKAEEIPREFDRMVARKVREMPELTAGAVRKAVELAAEFELRMGDRDPGKLNLRRWAETEAVA